MPLSTPVLTNRQRGSSLYPGWNTWEAGARAGLDEEFAAGQHRFLRYQIHPEDLRLAVLLSARGVCAHVAYHTKTSSCRLKGPALRR